MKISEMEIIFHNYLPFRFLFGILIYTCSYYIFILRSLLLKNNFNYSLWIKNSSNYMPIINVASIFQSLSFYFSGTLNLMYRLKSGRYSYNSSINQGYFFNVTMKLDFGSTEEIYHYEWYISLQPHRLINFKLISVVLHCNPILAGMKQNFLDLCCRNTKHLYRTLCLENTMQTLPQALQQWCIYKVNGHWWSSSRHLLWFSLQHAHNLSTSWTNILLSEI